MVNCLLGCPYSQMITAYSTMYGPRAARKWFDSVSECVQGNLFGHKESILLSPYFEQGKHRRPDGIPQWTDQNFYFVSFPVNSTPQPNLTSMRRTGTLYLLRVYGINSRAIWTRLRRNSDWLHRASQLFLVYLLNHQIHPLCFCQDEQKEADQLGRKWVCIRHDMFNKDLPERFVIRMSDHLSGGTTTFLLWRTSAELK